MWRRAESIGFDMRVVLFTGALARVRGEMQRLDPALPITGARALIDVIDESVKPQRFSMTVVGVFALVALGLAGIGIYGVLANASASRRTRSACAWHLARPHRPSFGPFSGARWC